MLVADSCGDANAWCRDDRYHLDLAKDSLNRFVENGSPVGDMPSGVSLVNAWSSTITTSGTTWTVKAPSWATSLAPGASASFGFQAAGPSTPGPTAITCS